MGKFGTFLKISTFWLKPDFKSRICPILCQSDPFQTQIWHTCLSDGDSHSRLPITLMTHTFFTFQSNVGNYYQWWWLFIMFVLDLDFSFEMFHFIQQGFTCTSMNNSISAEIQMLNSMSHWITRFPRILGKQRPVYTCDSVVCRRVNRVQKNWRQWGHKARETPEFRKKKHAKLTTFCRPVVAGLFTRQ